MTSEGIREMTIKYSPTENPTGIRLVDLTEQRQFTIRTPETVSLEEVDPDQFWFPVTRACRIETTGLFIDRLDGVHIHDGEGNYQTTIKSHETREFGFGTYSVDIHGPLKLYIHVTSAMTINTGGNHLYIEFDDTTEIHLGLRSYHKQPAGTITVPDDPHDLMTAVGMLSSALKTISCERSYPTLRGHPPLFERGDRLEIPNHIESPDTGIRIVVPPEYRYIYTVSSLAFYLGADVVAGDVPRIETSNGFVRDLASRRWFEDEVSCILRQVFFLDCIVRTEGIYQMDLQERQLVEQFLPFDIKELYDKPLQEQLEAYLQIPYEVVSEHVPKWTLTAHVPSSPEGITPTPFVVNELGIVREPRGTRISQPRTAAASYSRSPDDSTAESISTRPLMRSGRMTDDDVTFVEPETTNESIEHSWFGNHVPRGATKATTEAFMNRVSRDNRSSQIDITLICNDERMIAEHDSLDGVYGNRNELPYNIESHVRLSTDELEELLLNGDIDFLHYIGHATPSGLECFDGELDVRGLEDIDVEVFLLNACQSYNQAIAMAERGATGGVGTLSDVVNEHAIEIGKALAHLINLGFRLRAAVNLVREHTHIGDQYLIVGDGGADIVQSEGGPPSVCEVTPRDDGLYDLSVRMYPTREFQIGSTVLPTLQEITENCLLPGRRKVTGLTETELCDYLSSHTSPVQLNGEIRWNDLPTPVDLSVGEK
jgi:hypothetical protein